MAILLAIPIGCTAAQPGPCDRKQVDDLIAQLDAADPHARGRILVEHLDEVCELEPLYNWGDHDFGLTDAGEAAFARACFAGPARLDTIERQQLDQFYLACGLGRFGVISPSEYRLQPETHAFPWALHQWLLDHGLQASQARPITRAALLHERAEAARVRVRDDIRLPASEGEHEFAGLLVEVSAGQIQIGSILVELDEGRLDKGGVEDNDAFMAVYGELESHAYRGQDIAQMLGEPWVGRLVIAADIDAPRAVVSELVDFASRLGYSHFVTLAEPRLYEYTTQPIVGPLRRPEH